MTEVSSEFMHWVETNGDLNPEVRRPKPPLLKRVFASGLVAFTMTAIGIAGGGEIVAGDPAFVPNYAIANATEHDCGTTPVKFLKQVNRELSQPSLYAGYLLNRIETGEKNAIRDYHDFAGRQAHKFGLTLVNEEPYQKVLQTTKSVEAIMELLNSFSSNYGFGIELVSNDLGLLMRPLSEQGLSSDEPVDTSKLRVEDFKKGARRFMQSFYYFPKELVERSELETVRLLGKLKPDREKGSIAGEAYSRTQTISFDIKEFNSHGSALFSHELGHMIDRALCGMAGAGRDDEYKALNPKGFTYDGTGETTNAMTAWAYGNKNIYEDKATMFEDMLDELDPALFSSDSPVIRDKYRLLLARLEEAVPGTSKYLAAISSRTILSPAIL